MATYEIQLQGARGKYCFLESWCCQCSVLSSDRPVEIEQCRTERFYRTLKMVVKFNFKKKKMQDGINRQ